MPRVHRVVCAIDCGTVVNPDTVAQQVESSVNFALSAALFGKIDIQDGVVQQTNFHQLPLGANGSVAGSRNLDCAQYTVA
jgi:isoquinoline 1-oxidoreductase subunit beta